MTGQHVALIVIYMLNQTICEIIVCKLFYISLMYKIMSFTLASDASTFTSEISSINIQDYTTGPPPIMNTSYSVSFQEESSITLNNFNWSLSNTNTDFPVGLTGGFAMNTDSMGMTTIMPSDVVSDLSYAIQPGTGGGNPLFGFDPNQSLLVFNIMKLHFFPGDTTLVPGDVFTLVFNFDVVTSSTTTTITQTHVLNILEPPPPPPSVVPTSISVTKDGSEVVFNKEFSQDANGIIEIYTSETIETGTYNIGQLELTLDTPSQELYNMSDLTLFLYQEMPMGPPQLLSVGGTSVNGQTILLSNIQVDISNVDPNNPKTNILYILSDTGSSDGFQNIRILQIGGGNPPLSDTPTAKVEKTADILWNELGDMSITQEDVSGILGTVIVDPETPVDLGFNIQNPNTFKKIIDQVFLRNVGQNQMKMNTSNIPVSIDAASSILKMKPNAQVFKSDDTQVINFSDIINDTNKDTTAIYCPLSTVGDIFKINIAGSEYSIRKIGEGVYTVTVYGVETQYTNSETITLNGYVMQFGSVTIVQDDSATAETTTNNDTTQQQGSTTVPCFLEGTKILTSRGYKNVESLSSKDKLLNDKGQMIQCVEVKSFVQKYDGKTFPYVVPKGALMNNGTKCQMDLYLSPMHCIYNSRTNKFIPACVSGLPQDKTVVKSYKYYHVITPNYFTDVIIANGIPCESYSEQTLKYISKQKTPKLLLKSLLDACDANPETFERKKLSAKEFKEILKKNNKSLVMRI